MVQSKVVSNRVRVRVRVRVDDGNSVERQSSNCISKCKMTAQPVSGVGEVSQGSELRSGAVGQRRSPGLSCVPH